jgi:hypothetical protein
MFMKLKGLALKLPFPLKVYREKRTTDIARTLN